MATNERISDQMSIPSKYIDVKGSKIHYLESGEGDPILFLHGIPTSSYSWRNIIPHLSSLGTCIAPDLIGFGKSDKPNIRYTLADHIEYIKDFIDALSLKNITLIMPCGMKQIVAALSFMRHFYVRLMATTCLSHIRNSW